MNFESMPTGNQKTPEQESKKVENVDSYEMEQIKNTLTDLQRATRAIEVYLEEVREMDEQGIKVLEREKLDKIRYKNGPAGSSSDIGKIEVLFQSALVELGKAKKVNINEDGKETFANLYEKK